MTSTNPIVQKALNATATNAVLFEKDMPSNLRSIVQRLNKLKANNLMGNYTAEIARLISEVERAGYKVEERNIGPHTLTSDYYCFIKNATVPVVQSALNAVAMNREPKPGDKVFWRNGALKFEGIFVKKLPSGRNRVKTNWGEIDVWCNVYLEGQTPTSTATPFGKVYNSAL